MVSSALPICQELEQNRVKPENKKNKKKKKQKEKQKKTHKKKKKKTDIKFMLLLQLTMLWEKVIPTVLILLNAPGAAFYERECGGVVM